MQTFKDTVTGEFWQFEDDVRVEATVEGRRFFAPHGGALDAPLTLEPSELPPPPAVQVPASVTAAQGGIALIHFGHMDAVQAVVDAPDTPAEYKWAWSRATTWERNSPSFNYFADRAGISEQQKDELFVFAAGVVP
ncbi:hypothetical protein [Bradyrhizobium elkanii]|uniref:hypothetical protein n=1 Tax=Bradyrhizobium elkanii TaxID=29448 RepID=UPI003518D634